LSFLKDKNIVITGASSGIGRQIALEAAREGANVILIARNSDRLEETRSLAGGNKHLIYSFDITDFDKIDGLIDEIVTKTGLISGFVHSAGIESTIPFRNMKGVTYEEMMRVNVISGLEFARSIARKKSVNPEGAGFVFIGSVMGDLGKEGKVGYCATKGALTSSVKAMALELSNKKIRCNSIQPGIVQTEMVKHLFETLPESSVADISKQHPLGLGAPEDVANLAIFLLSEKSRWITGSEIIIDGGYSAQ
jgi:NAD(P)-dependent dehydrogenase (short-subunit alcohol dehydrogenase family)